MVAPTCGAVKRTLLVRRSWQVTNAHEPLTILDRPLECHSRWLATEARTCAYSVIRIIALVA